jgi:hypothetical protein
MELSGAVSGSSSAFVQPEAISMMNKNFDIVLI